MQNYLIGYAQKILTPQLPIDLAGYNPIRKAIGIHDDIYVRVITFSNDEALHVIVSLDVLAVDHLLYDGVKQRLLRKGIELDSLHIFATHTHSSVAGICDTENGVLKGTEGIVGEVDETLVNHCVHHCTEAILAALDNKQSFTMEIAKGTVTGVGKERHNPNKPGDEALVTICFYLENGKKLLLYHLACHPTVLNSENAYLSADLPHGVEKKLVGYDLVLFINGNGGDISTRFTRNSSSFEQIDRFGEIIAQAIKKTTKYPYFRGAMRHYKVTNKVIHVKAKEVESVQLAEERLEKLKREVTPVLATADPAERRVLESRLEGENTNLLLAKNLRGIKEIPLHCSIIQMNGLTSVTFPSEVFSSLTRKLKAKDQVSVFAYCNGFNFYLADDDAYEKNYYEALSSPFAKGEGERIIEEIETLLSENK
ncbi:Neutral/alkaline non-lysosomal ceramidase [Paraliobacillus sp. PM-2]|uniref:neutral/alkaline non-lysosomal ceramidase N-terminal domain-containing protein n=1 Tax=Paraliobacillus sp. PM-2 TaxID=1462524 RepID=UPI00061BA89B|nr:neutral/alkaline non-lysosomal ceramidase N-terminal domain-containing protein [Paraliobacillus sp. PM-2]CQR46264.1 Neutral/alkaline non-lysosomal ceramidase [Paraliobacillus sp. PM-2]